MIYRKWISDGYDQFHHWVYTQLYLKIASMFFPSDHYQRINLS